MMIDTHVFNGQLVEEPFQVGTSNRAFKYGDALFETIKVAQRHPLFYRSHYSRLIRGLDALGMAIPENFHFSYFLKSIQQLIEHTDVENGMIRVQAWRSGKGTYSPQSNEFDWLIELSKNQPSSPFFDWHQSEYSLGIFDELPKNQSVVSAYKTANALPYVLAGHYAEKNGFNNVLLLNDEHFVVESIAENVFIYSHGVVQTPPLSDGPIEGIMRSMIRKLLQWNDIEFREQSMTIADVKAAQEVFLTNSQKGIIPVTTFDGKRYFQSFSEGMFHKLNERIAQIIERN